MDRRNFLAMSGMLGAGVIAGCSNSSSGGNGGVTPGPGASPSPTKTAIDPLVRSQLATGLDVPWGIAFLASGDALISMRETGDVVRVTAAGDSQTVGTVPGVQGGRSQGGEGGLLGIAFPPKTESALYAYVTTTTDNRIVKMSFKRNQLGEPEDVFTGIPNNVHHNGGRILFGSDGNLFVATGDAMDPQSAQDKKSLAGKILRITPSGDAAANNPFDSPIYSFGHRNIEGLAFDRDGRLWSTEFGDKSADELNLIEAGKNYGWPEVEGISGDKNFVDPKMEWRPTSSASPAGLAILASTAFVGALQGKCLYGVPLEGEEAGKPVSYFNDEYGRIRSVAAAPDGALWVTTSNTDGRADPKNRDDRILRVQI